MDLISYALSKKVKKYVDDSIVQPDWDEQDETSPAYVKNKTHYYKLKSIFNSGFGFYQVYETDDFLRSCICYKDGSLITVGISLDKTSLFCIEINGQKIHGLTPNPSSKILLGDTDISIWTNGEGYGFQIAKITASDVRLYWDESRFGSLKDNVVNIYIQTIEKELDPDFLPLTSPNKRGTVLANTINPELESNYTECLCDGNGRLYSKKYAQVETFSELSLSNLNSTYEIGQHYLFTDSISDEISAVANLTLPVHAWYLKQQMEKQFLLESADGAAYLLGIYNGKIISTTQISTALSSGGTLIVTPQDGSLDYTPAELCDALDSGKNVVLLLDGIMLQLVCISLDRAIFTGVIFDENELSVFTVGFDTDGNMVNPSISAVPTIPSSSVILNSSTEGSSKQFEITVDDSGTITATEIN